MIAAPCVAALSLAREVTHLEREQKSIPPFTNQVCSVPAKLLCWMRSWSSVGSITACAASEVIAILLLLYLFRYPVSGTRNRRLGVALCPLITTLLLGRKADHEVILIHIHVQLARPVSEGGGRGLQHAEGEIVTRAQLELFLQHLEALEDEGLELLIERGPDSGVDNLVLAGGEPGLKGVAREDGRDPGLRIPEGYRDLRLGEGGIRHNQVDHGIVGVPHLRDLRTVGSVLG